MAVQGVDSGIGGCCYFSQEYNYFDGIVSYTHCDTWFLLPSINCIVVTLVTFLRQELKKQPYLGACKAYYKDNNSVITFIIVKIFEL